MSGGVKQLRINYNSDLTQPTKRHFERMTNAPSMSRPDNQSFGIAGSVAHYINNTIPTKSSRVPTYDKQSRRNQKSNLDHVLHNKSAHHLVDYDINSPFKQVRIGGN